VTVMGMGTGIGMDRGMLGLLVVHAGDDDHGHGYDSVGGSDTDGDTGGAGISTRGCAATIPILYCFIITVLPRGVLLAVICYHIFLHRT
jgi:hypothetical protein